MSHNIMTFWLAVKSNFFSSQIHMLLMNEEWAVISLTTVILSMSQIFNDLFEDE
jgi:hypothetical protein